MATEAADDGPAGLQPADLGIGILFDALHDAVVVSDGAGRILLWNRGAEAIFGWSRAEAEGRDVSIIVPDRLREAHRRGMARFARTGHGRLVDTHAPVELPGLRKDGSENVVELTLSSLESNGRRYALALLRDVTDRVRLREDLERRSGELERTNAALQRANDSLTAFTYVVSHDLKEPVRAIDTYLGMLREDYGKTLPPDAAELLDRAQLATVRLSALLRGLLELSRVDREDLQMKVLTVGEVLRSEPCRAVYDGLLRERGGDVELRDGPPVHASSSVLCQVLGNLVTNALRHSTAERPFVRVSVQLRDDAVVEVRVDDNGSGFPDAFLERFNRTGEGGSLKKGFGLLIARRAVERLGGRLWLDRSKEMGGASVRFTLPRGREA